MDQPARPAVPDDATGEATISASPFAEADRARIAARNARIAARIVDPAAAAAADARWQAENADAIKAINAWYERNGHPLAAYFTDSDHPLTDLIAR